MISERSLTRTYPKCVGGFVQVCLTRFSIASMNAHKHKEHGNGPLPLSNACKFEDHNSNIEVPFMGAMHL
jgi:hypothetical protein